MLATYDMAVVYESGDSVLILRQKAGNGLGQLGWEEVCELKTQIIIDGAMINHVKLILNMGRCAQQASALMAGGLDGRW